MNSVPNKLDYKQEKLVWYGKYVPGLFCRYRT